MHKGKGKLSGVLHKGFKPDKCKTALRMAVARIKLLRNRKEVQVRQMRRELAQLLEADQDQTARIRVEHVIREEKMMAAYDLMEVYCELIVARMTIIESQKNCPIDLKEAIASVIFASMRCSDVTELVDVRKQFSTKYGKEFAAAALEVRPDSGVSRLVIEKLSAGAPDVQTKIKTLSSIAEEHNIKWEPKAFEEKLQKQNEDLLYGSTAYSGANIPTMGSSTSSMSTSQPTFSGASTTVESSTSHIPPAPVSYSSANNPSNSNAFSHENRRVPGASVPPSSHYGSTTYPSAEIPGFNHFSQENAGGPGVSRPHSQSQYAATVSDTPSREDEVSQPWERKSLVSDSNQNIEFKDATSAAQAAAESAEMASIAARAAAQLASRGNFSAGPNTGAYGSATYIHENTPNKQPVEHLVKAEKRSFDKQRSGIDDPRYVETTETNRAGGQNIPTAYSPSQFHSYGPKSHASVYGMPTEQPPSHSSESPLYDDLDKREGNIRRTEVHQFDLPEERLSDAGLGGRNIKDMESRQTSLDNKYTNNYYSNIASSHGGFTHNNSTVWDDHTDKVTGDSSAVVFDQYDSDVEKHPTFGMHHEENLLDSSTNYKNEAPTSQEDNRFSPGADWNQWHRSGSLVHDNNSTLFSRADTQPSDNLEGSRKDSHSPYSYDNAPPTFDSDGDISDEDEITTTMHVETLRSHSSGSGFTGEKKEAGANRISEKLDPDANKSSEEYESRSTKKYQNASAEEQIVYSGGRIGDSFFSEQETEPHELKGASSAVTEATENKSLTFSMQTSATSDDKDTGELGLNFGRLTPGLRNKPRQPPTYSKNFEDNVLPKETLHKTPASIEVSVHSYENDASLGQTGNTTTSYRTTKNSFGEDYNEELYDKRQGVGTFGEARSTMTRNYFDSDDTDKLYEQTGNTPRSSRTTRSSIGANSSRELYNEKPAVGARMEARSRMTRNYFDSDDSEDERAQQQTVQTKWSREQMQSRRTREVTSDSKRDVRYRTRVQLTDETESMPQEAKHPTEAFPNAATEERTEAPMYPKVPVQRSSLKPVQIEPSLSRGKSQETVLNKSPVPETSGGTPTETTPKATPSHVHPKLPDYDSFAAHFQSLRTNRR